MEEVEIFVSDDMLRELREVAFRPKFQGLIGFGAIMALFELISAKCKVVNDYPDVESAIRDVKDLYLLSMAESIPVRKKSLARCRKWAFHPSKSSKQPASNFSASFPANREYIPS